MAEERFLVVRLTALGDIVHTLPAVAALRDAFPRTRMDWVVERKWAAVVRACPDLDAVIPFDRGGSGLLSGVRQLRSNRYTCAIDFQGLYKSAVLAWLSGAKRRIGFDRHFAREGGAPVFYTERVVPHAGHVIEHNLALAERAGARRGASSFRLRVPVEAQAEIDRRLAERGLREFFVLSPGGGWGAKLWPPERYGELYRGIERRYGWPGVVTFGPGESGLVETVCRAAAPAEPLHFATDLAQVMALLARAKFVVAADTGPLHLAVALGTPVIGLYGPTDPKRNGPLGPGHAVIRNARPEETSYKRRKEHAATMLSISVEQVLSAIEHPFAQNQRSLG